MSRKTSCKVLTAVAMASALGLSACGGGSDDAAAPASPTTTATSTGAAAGSDVKAKLLVVGDFTSTIPFTVQEIAPMAKGVLKSFPNVRIDTCDAKGTAAGFLVCEQQAVSNKVAAVVLGFSAGAQDQSVLTKAEIPVIGNGDAKSPNIYPSSESFSGYVALGAGLAETGCKKLGIVYLDGSDFLVDYIKMGFEGKGGKEVARGAVPATAADLTPAVSKVTGAGAECVAVSQTPSGAAQALTALKQSGKKLTIGGISAIFSPQLITALGPLTEDLIVVDSALNPADDAQGLKDAAATMTAVDPKAKMTQQAVSAFVASKLVAAALPKVSGEVTNVSMKTALDGLRDVDMNGVIHPWSSTPLDSKTFPRIFNHYGINYKIQGGKPVKQGDFYDTSALLVGK
ncbi:MAG: putative substrate-binding transporter protein component [Frankiales bacterium]|nr:putative substrate-binding transporter protein component [Frankiales bacterium]